MRLPRSRHPRAQAPLISRASRRESSRPEPQRRPPACTPRFRRGPAIAAGAHDTARRSPSRASFLACALVSLPHPKALQLFASDAPSRSSPCSYLAAVLHEAANRQTYHGDHGRVGDHDDHNDHCDHGDHGRISRAAAARGGKPGPGRRTGQSPPPGCSESCEATRISRAARQPSGSANQSPRLQERAGSGRWAA